MIINSVRIQNFKALKDVELPLSSLVCIIGENNSGKSSTLLALDLLINGPKITENEFFDKTLPILIEVELSSIEEIDLERIKEEHRNKLRALIIDGKIKLIRKYDKDGNKLLVKRLFPIDERFDSKKINEILKGQKGKDVEKTMIEHFPEYDFKGVTKQKKAKDIIDLIIDEMNPMEKAEKEGPLPSGIPESIKYLFPEPVYIAASKDLSDETKTNQTATFGKLIKVILELIENADELENIIKSFDELKKKLNVLEDDNGKRIDERIDEMKEIESLLNSYLQENFPQTQLEIEVPPPSLNKVFSGSRIKVNDGVEGDLESKGDGLKRAVIFALLRTYVEKNRQNSNSKYNRPYLFLFEEPELYLHPTAQRILFQALSNISNDGHQVIVTTHSPFFFSYDSTETFIKMKRIKENSNHYSITIPVNIHGNTDIKDLFQLICFENNNAAFFSDKVLLVEGDSDLIFFKHIAKVLNDEWDFDANNIHVIRLNGTGNSHKYKEFFKHFEIDVHIILDLDVIINEFDKLDATEAIQSQCNTLKSQLAELASRVDGSPRNRQEVEKIVQNFTFRERYEKVKNLCKSINSAKFITGEEANCLDELYNYMISSEQDKVMKEILNSDRDVLELKKNLLKSLRDENIYI